MFKKFIYNHDWIITSTIFLILTIGVLTIYSTSILNPSQGSFEKQVIFAVAGFLMYFLISIADYTYIKYKPVIFILYGIDIFLLLLAFLVGHNVRGAVRWLNFGILNLQPSEITKAIVIITIASFLSFNQGIKDKDIFLKTLILLAPLAFLVFIEPSLSSTIVLLFIWGSIVFVNLNSQIKGSSILLLTFLSINLGGAFLMPQILFPYIKDISIGVLLITIATFLCIYLFKIIDLKTIIIIALTGIILGAGFRYVVWTKVLRPYQQERITAFLSQDASDVNNPAVFQVRQSKIAIGSGELLGKGFAQGTQSKLNFLPDHNTDFIFASFSEEFGLFGDCILLSLFSILFFRLISITEKVTDPFGFVLMCGIVSMLVFQTFVNIGINMGMLPSTGIPMPFVSYGGSSLWVTFLLLGITQSIYKETKSKKWLSIEI